ncbi:dGTPase [Alteromonas aestuariivivens]|uniref:Probable deoxyguanosinetriphosphate triphosphohydrolase n=1 Tax=Alteromonas aestuariivivens TaxID=1938339 RepID=A0A3D8MEN6_9ALTE|nr:dGTPase [Alteromonas aestuariivivens]RDV28974.1 dGTPase [Alteromonas aestuariivivens]
MKPIDFSTKLTSQRKLGKPAAILQTALESDRGRIINSAAVRRLQQKTQVFPLERNAAVRSRLTHSLEVQQVGRFIVQQIEYRLSKLQRGIVGDCREWFRAIESLVEMACLMHDIGNPPFGHFGEKAISDWFAHNLQRILPNDLRLEAPLLYFSVSNDLRQFEGNAQAIRIVTSLLNLNLTYSQIAGLTKYTRPAYLDKKDIPEARSYLMRKPGYYLSEKTQVEEMYRALNMSSQSRHFLSYIMEAADDISYCFADIEDAVEKNILSVNELMTLLPEAFESLKQKVDDPTLEYFGRRIRFTDMLKTAYESYSRETVDKDHQFFISLRVQLQHILVNFAAKRFVDNFDAIFAGTFNAPLLEDHSPAHFVAEAFKKVALEQVFCHSEVELQELRGHRILSGLLDYYMPLLLLPKDAFGGLIERDYGFSRQHPVEQRLINKLPRKHVRAYRNAVENPIEEAVNAPRIWEKYCRCRLIQDFISGMTDQFAYDEYKSLTVQD